MKGLAASVKGTSKNAVLPFDNKTADNVEKQALWYGPKHLGFFVLELYGPMQLLFWCLSILALVLLIIEISKQSEDEGIDFHRFSTAVGCFVFASLLGWFSKALYILRLFRIEICNFRRLNKDLEAQVEGLTKNIQELGQENDKYKTENGRHEELNKTLSERLAEHEAQNRMQEELNSKLNAEVEELQGSVKDLKHVEDQLLLLSNECAGSVEQARGLLDRLERNLKLDTVNTVFLFFDRCDRNHDGKIDTTELDVFVDNLSHLWKHVDGFDKGKLKESLIEQGGISLEQAHTLVDSIMLGERPENQKKLAESFSPRALAKELSLAMAENEEPISAVVT